MTSSSTLVEITQEIKAPEFNVESHRILLIESDFYLSSSFQVTLAEKGYSVTHARYSDLLDQKLKVIIASIKPDMIIADLGHSSSSKLETIREIRSFYQDFLIVISSSRNEEEEVESFQLGVDEYLIKPVSANILSVRASALFRRNNQKLNINEENSICVGDILLEPKSQKCFVNNEKVKLTGFEFNLLKLLLINQGSILSRDNIYIALLGRAYNGTERTVDVRVSQLREKLISGNMKKCQIETVWGKGYMVSLISNSLAS
jgi:DNA-binding response OmpR family regulator